MYTHRNINNILKLQHNIIQKKKKKWKKKGNDETTSEHRIATLIFERKLHNKYEKTELCFGGLRLAKRVRLYHIKQTIPHIVILYFQAKVIICIYICTYIERM